VFKGEEDGATVSKSSKNWQDVEEDGQNYEVRQEYNQYQPRSRYQSSHNSGYSGEYRRAFAYGNRGNNNKKTWYRNRGPSHSQHGSNYQYS
jgi:protein required for attachment to host cells